VAVVDRIRFAVRQLLDCPLAGRLVPELRSVTYREVIAGRYRIIYRFDAQADRVIVLAVVHGARQLPPIEERE
jgi:plasmid stabilization system protein ParE